MNNNIDNLIAKIAGKTISEEKNNIYLDLLNEELKEFLKNCNDVDKTRHYFICLTEKYPELREASDKLQEKLISILIQRFEVCKYNIKEECKKFIQDSKIESYFKEGIRFVGDNRDNTVLLQNLLTLIQWSHKIDLNYLKELIDFLIENSCDEHFNKLNTTN